MASVVRSTALRAGGACVRCRKGKTKCVYENGRAPCKNCAKGLHDCYLPSESMSHGGHGVSPARVQQRARESLPSERTVSSTSGDRQAPPASSVSRHVSTTTEKYVHFSFLSVVPFVFHLQSQFSFFSFSSVSGRASFFGFASFLSFSALFSGRAPSAAPFFARSRLPPPAESFRFASWLPEARRQAPIFSARPSISQTGTRNFPLLRAHPPSHLRLSWPWHTANGGRRSDSPCRSCRNPPASQMRQHLVVFSIYLPRLFLTG